MAGVGGSLRGSGISLLLLLPCWPGLSLGAQIMQYCCACLHASGSAELLPDTEAMSSIDLLLGRVGKTALGKQATKSFLEAVLNIFNPFLCKEELHPFSIVLCRAGSYLMGTDICNGHCREVCLRSLIP